MFCEGLSTHKKLKAVRTDMAECDLPLTWADQFIFMLMHWKIRANCFTTVRLSARLSGWLHKLNIFLLFLN